MTVDDDDVQVWFAQTADINDAARFARYESLLDRTEKATCDRLAGDAHRRLYVLSHALVRTTLGDCLGVEPSALRFGRTRHGRPYLLDTASSAPIMFNLAHSDGVAVLAVTRSRAIGIDVESSRRLPCVDDLLPVALSGDERRDLAQYASEERTRRFIRYWVLKEAYLKAEGVGFSTPPADVSFLLGGTGPYHIVLARPAPGALPRTWSFRMFEIANDYCVAVCAEAGAKGFGRLEVRRCVPLEGNAVVATELRGY